MIVDDNCNQLHTQESMQNDMQNDMQKQQIQNRQGQVLSYCLQGPVDAPVLIFSNSLGTDLNMWQAQADYFKQDFQVLRYDSRGHGESAVHAEADLRLQAEDVLDLMDALNIESAHFCGISMGGQVAMQLGLMAQQRFKSLTIANSAAKIGQAEAWRSRAEQVLAEGLAELVKTTHTRWFSENFAYQQHVVAKNTIQSLANTPAEGYAAACFALSKVDFRGQLGQIKVPVLVICGEFDPVTTPEDGIQLQAEIAGSQLKCVPASHLSNIEVPDAFNQVLADFIKQVEAA